MESSENRKGPRAEIDFVQQASEKQAGFIKEFWLFLGDNKKWWLTPIMVILLLLGIVVILGSTAAAPFIYTLF